ADRKQALIGNPDLEKKFQAMMVRVKEQSEKQLREKEQTERKAGFILTESSALRKQSIRLPDENFVKGTSIDNNVVRKVARIKREISELMGQDISSKQKKFLESELGKWEIISQHAEERIKRKQEIAQFAKANSFRNSLNEGKKTLQQTINECNLERQRLAMLRFDLADGSEETKRVEAELETLNKLAEELGAMKKETEMARLERLVKVQRGFEESQVAKINLLVREVEKGKISLKEALNRAKKAREYLLDEIGESKGPRRNIYIQGARMWAEVMREFEEKSGERKKGI
ncbi:MAG: hypothetical protein WC462_03370, partial [archaeon]